ncbi:MAG TPA: DUF1801 domain-containing protein [Candidatus Saccharimonadales bacterium]|nr:DUF1801 domain-containing protein [Candidatus Saccharimonadales bacterium]
MAAKTTYTSIDEYISAFPAEVQSILKKTRQTIQKALPDTTETISYQIPTFNLNGKYVVYFACWKHHIALYPIPTGDEAFQKAIAPYISGKGTVRFPLDKPIPYDLVEKIATFRMKEAVKKEGKKTT